MAPLGELPTPVDDLAPVIRALGIDGAEAYAKQVTAAGFQLKGSGWYVTDFRSNGAAAKDDKKAETAKADAKAAGGDKPVAAEAAAAPAAAAKPAEAAAPAASPPPPASGA